ncbi:MAG: tRNA epoxyqueuosine(34) reductase QueG, partial [Macromonas bipunctata]|nr:tRNA epoxyqueuosine(34) reductase QueG [Macromonas bipunctata]
MFDAVHFVSQVQAWGRALGFAQIGVAGVDLYSAEPGLLAWLAEGRHGDMHYMASHGLKRARPAELVPGTL